MNADQNMSGCRQAAPRKSTWRAAMVARVTLPLALVASAVMWRIESGAFQEPCSTRPSHGPPAASTPRSIRPDVAGVPAQSDNRDTAFRVLTHEGKAGVPLTYRHPGEPVPAPTTVPIRAEAAVPHSAPTFNRPPDEEVAFQSTEAAVLHDPGMPPTSALVTTPGVGVPREDLPVGALGGPSLSEIRVVKVNGSELVDNSTTTSTARGTAFGAMIVGVTSVTNRFLIFNDGLDVLNLNGTPRVRVVGANAGDFVVVEEPAAQLAPGSASTAFSIAFRPLGSGTRTARVEIDNDDVNENPFDFAVSGTATARDLALSGNGVIIADGDMSPSAADHTDFGNILNQTALLRSFRVNSAGTASLQLTGNPPVSVSGSHASEFVVTSQPSASISAGQFSTFTLRFQPTGPGLRSAVVRIASNDPAHPLYSFAVQGSSTAAVQAHYLTGLEIPGTIQTLLTTGPVATVDFQLLHEPAPGAEFTVVQNVGTGLSTGYLQGLGHGDRLNLTFGSNTYFFVADYHGGDGNDLVLRWHDNRVFAWGGNAHGQLGLGGTDPAEQPTALALPEPFADHTVMSLAAGAFHNLALCSDGTILAWGRNQHGQLGDGTTITRDRPVEVLRTGPLATRRVVAVAAGLNFSMALCEDGAVATWGWNAYGQLGNDTLTSRSTPGALFWKAPAEVRYARAISAGGYHALALCTDGTVMGWGLNTYRQLGITTAGNEVTRPAFMTVSATMTGRQLQSIQAGNLHSSGLFTDGTLMACGLNDVLQAGGSNSSSPVTTASAVTIQSYLNGRVPVALDAGDNHNLVLYADSTLATWGNNNAGQFGNGGTTGNYRPQAANSLVLLGGKQVGKIAAGAHHSLALATDGTLVGWGYNLDGQLGDRTRQTRLGPVLVNTSGLPAGARVSGLFSGSPFHHSLAVVAMPVTPRLEVRGNTHAVVAGSITPALDNHTDFGAISTTAGGRTRAFVLRNAGGAPLGLTGSPVVEITGPDANAFQLAPPADGTLSHAQTTELSIAFLPTSVGTKNATVRIPSTDPYQPEFTFAIRAEALPDLAVWRLEHFGDSGNTGPGADTADADLDGDTNLHEYVAGTNPTNTASRVRMRVESTGPQPPWVVFGPVAPGRAYQVEWTNSLASPNWQAVPGGAGAEAAGERWVPDPASGSNRRYYRLQIRLP